jgi:hypothetical protein
MSTKPANEATWQCPKCKRWQGHKRGICMSEFDTGVPCDGKQPHPAAPADAGDATKLTRYDYSEDPSSDYAAIIESDNGKYVKYEDHAAALAAARRLLDAPPGVGECETCAKLPKTKDGVPIVPGMRVFVSDVGQEGTVEGITSPIEDKFYTSSIVTDDGAHRRPPAAYVFSTRAAALAPAASSAAEGSVATGEGGQ